MREIVELLRSSQGGHGLTPRVALRLLGVIHVELLRSSQGGGSLTPRVALRLLGVIHVELLRSSQGGGSLNPRVALRLLGVIHVELLRSFLHFVSRDKKSLIISLYILNLMAMGLDPQSPYFQEMLKQVIHAGFFCF